MGQVWVSLVAQLVKNLHAMQETACRRHGFHCWVGKIPWRKEWQPSPVFLSGEFHRLKSLEGYSPSGHKELYTTEATWCNTFSQDTTVGGQIRI